MNKFVNKWMSLVLFVMMIITSQVFAADPISAELVYQDGTIQPGQPINIAIRLHMEGTWHTYANIPEYEGMAPMVKWTLPDNFIASDLIWPEPKPLGEIIGYEKELILHATITPPAHLSGDTAKILANIAWVCCNDSFCAPQTAALSLVIPQNGSVQDGFLLTLGLAFLGGLILNLMPCVLPVISFKILSFVKMSGQNRSLILKHGLAFSAGVILSFWVLAGVILVLSAYGHSVGWGFQLQDPLFVAILATIIFIFSLSLFGLFELGAGLASRAGAAQGKPEGLTSSFMSGVLATTIATPCTGPFLGTAIGFAVTLSAPLALLVFTSIGMGMALPYMLIGAFPSLIRFLPKPGNWMVTFKEILGFVMLATVLWLVWVFTAQTDETSLIYLLIGFFFFSVGSWIYGKWGSPINSGTVRRIGILCSVVFMGFGGYSVYHASSTMPNQPIIEGAEVAMADINEPPTTWINYSPKQLDEFQKAGIPVFVDFTAKWCLICQTNHISLTTPEVDRQFTESGIVRMKADWTKKDPAIGEALRKFGRNGVPLYVLYVPGAEPYVFPQILTPETILEQIRDIKRT